MVAHRYIDIYLSSLESFPSCHRLSSVPCFLLRLGRLLLLGHRVSFPVVMCLGLGIAEARKVYCRFNVFHVRSCIVDVFHRRDGFETRLQIEASNWARQHGQYGRFHLVEKFINRCQPRMNANDKRLTLVVPETTEMCIKRRCDRLCKSSIGFPLPTSPLFRELRLGGRTVSGASERDTCAIDDIGKLHDACTSFVEEVLNWR